MNDYGYFVFEDYPLDAKATISTNYDVQDQSDDIIVLKQSDLINLNYTKFATLELDEFDFFKPLYNSEYYQSQGKIGNISKDLSDTFGRFKDNDVLKHMSINVVPEEHYSGSGFTVMTLMDNYVIRIKVNDKNGIRTQYFFKTTDEFYSFPFDALIDVEFTFSVIQPYHFIKVIGINFGTVRLLQESELVDIPTITNHFSLTGEELEYDILELKVRQKDMKFVIGERITYSRTKQVFYISNVQTDEEGNASLTCYDDIYRLESKMLGAMRNNDNSATMIQTLLKGSKKDISVTVDSLLIENQTYSGTLDPDSYRETARLMLQGNCGRVKRLGNSSFKVFNPMLDNTIKSEFNDHTITSVPQIDKSNDPYEVRFSKHYYSEDRTNGKQEFFNGYIRNDGIPEVIEFSGAVSRRATYYVSGTDTDGNDILTPVSSSKFTVINGGAYFIEASNLYKERIVCLAYPYKSSTYIISAVNPLPRETFNDTQIRISDCSVIVDMSNYDEFREFLLYVYSFNRKISFESITEANAGDYVSITFDGNTYNGWVTSKKDTLNGIFQYEVACK